MINISWSSVELKKTADKTVDENEQRAADNNVKNLPATGTGYILHEKLMRFFFTHFGWLNFFFFKFEPTEPRSLGASKPRSSQKKPQQTVLICDWPQWQKKAGYRYVTVIRCRFPFWNEILSKMKKIW